MKAYKHNGSGSSLGALVKVTPTTEAGEWSDDYRRGRVDGLEQARVEAEARIAPLREALLDAFREAKARIAVSHEDDDEARASLNAVAARDAEIERLARRVAIADVNLGLCADEANRLRTEVERLRKALGLVLTSRSEAE